MSATAEQLVEHDASLERPLLEVQALTKTFTPRRRVLGGTTGAPVHAVRDVSFALHAGEVLGIVGSSGSGKTTLARLLLRLIEPTAGAVRLGGADLLSFSDEAVRTKLRPAIRMVFQDPDAALNPAYTIGDGMSRALRLGGRVPEAKIADTVRELLQLVGLDASYTHKYPDELSGGEKRRLGICRALSSDPQVIVADEPLSGLDVVLQERVLSLLLHEQQRRGFALVLVSHDLDRVHQVCDRVLVMYAGRVVEEAVVKRNAGNDAPRYHHPYSSELEHARDALLTPAQSGVGSASGIPETGAGATVATPDAGCAYRPNCDRWRALGEPMLCSQSVPELKPIDGAQRVACHFPDG